MRSAPALSYDNHLDSACGYGLDALLAIKPPPEPLGFAMVLGSTDSAGRQASETGQESL
jgi:hypothetical protein